MLLVVMIATTKIMILLSVEETCNANRDAKVAYFRNEAYPEVDSETNYCSYNLKVD